MKAIESNLAPFIEDSQKARHLQKAANASIALGPVKSLDAGQRLAQTEDVMWNVLAQSDPHARLSALRASRALRSASQLATRQLHLSGQPQRQVENFFAQQPKFLSQSGETAVGAETPLKSKVAPGNVWLRGSHLVLQDGPRKPPLSYCALRYKNLLSGDEFLFEAVREDLPGSPRPLSSYEYTAFSLSFSNRFLAYRSHPSEVCVVDLSSGKERGRIYTDVTANYPSRGKLEAAQPARQELAFAFSADASDLFVQFGDASFVADVADLTAVSKLSNLSQVQPDSAPTFRLLQMVQKSALLRLGATGQYLHQQATAELPDWQVKIMQKECNTRPGSSVGGWPEWPSQHAFADSYSFAGKVAREAPARSASSADGLALALAGEDNSVTVFSRAGPEFPFQHCYTAAPRTISLFTDETFRLHGMVWENGQDDAEELYFSRTEESVSRLSFLRIKTSQVASQLHARNLESIYVGDFGSIVALRTLAGRTTLFTQKKKSANLISIDLNTLFSSRAAYDVDARYHAKTARVGKLVCITLAIAAIAAAGAGVALGARYRQD